MADKKGKGIDALYRMHAHALFSYALNLGFERETCMDAIHDIFYKICLNERLLDDVSNVRFYLLRALKNHLLNICKQKKEIVELPSDTSPHSMPFSIHVTIEDTIIEIEEDEKIRLKIERLLEKLTDREREIVYLRYSHAFSYEEIAKMMRITIPTCRKLIHKAMTKLRK